MSRLLTMETAMRFETRTVSPSAAHNNVGKNQGSTVSISPQGLPSATQTAANYPESGAPKAENDGGQGAKSNGAMPPIKNSFDRNECHTCKTRRYMDGSNDPGVSFKSPTSISPGASAGAVAAHENEHVTRNKAKAEEEGREVVSQTVILHTATCPECGVVYTAGGETTTVTRAKSKTREQQIDVRA
ncbi:MAG: hypothetical protein RR827_01125 [Oscillospiraceae bacterium]